MGLLDAGQSFYHRDWLDNGVSPRFVYLTYYVNQRS